MAWQSYANNVGATVMAWGLHPGGQNPLNTLGSTYTGLTNVSGSGATSLFGNATQGAGAGGCRTRYLRAIHRCRNRNAGVCW